MNSYEKFLAAQFVQNQNVNTVKTRLVFPTIDRNAEILSGGFNDSFSLSVLIAREFLTAG